MKYTIGKLAKLLNVSIETIRNYEKLGLISPVRDERNAYRLYNAVDLNVIRRARAYASCGIPLKQSVDLILNGDIGDLVSTLDQVTQSVSDRIAYDMMLLRYLELKRNHLNRISAMENRCAVENSPAMYCIIYREGLRFRADTRHQKLYTAWDSMRPFTESMFNCSRTFLLGGDYEYSHGLCIEKPFADFFGITESEDVRFFPSRKCLYALVAGVYEPQVSKINTAMNLVKRMLDEGGYEIDGDPIGRVVHTSRSRGTFNHYIETWVPIK